MNELVWSPSATTLADLNASSAGVDNTKYITFDFSAIEFGNPGVYRYVITETASAAVASGQYGTTGVDAGNNSQTETLYLDVYVRQSASYDASSATPANNWDVYGYALFKNDNSIDATYDTDSNEPAVSAAQKVSAFTTDTYYTYDLTITKTLVNDAMQNLNQFPFGIDFSGSVTGVLPKISGTASITTVPSTWTTAGAIDSAFDVATTDGTLKIANGGTVTIVGIPVGTTVSITEKNNVAGTTYSVTTSGADSFTTGTVYYNADSNAAAVTSTTTISGENYKTHAVTFTNTFAEISPTGIAFRVAPYALILAAGIVLFLIARRRKNSDAE